MSEITIRQSIQKGLAEALDADPNVFIMGEDIGDYGGAYAITSGFLQKYGPERIKDTPISEAAFIGAGIGSAAAGLKPIIELMSIRGSSACTFIIRASSATKLEVTYSWILSVPDS